MMRKIHVITLFIIAFYLSCSSSKYIGVSSKKLGFENCLEKEKRYSFVLIDVPKGAKKQKLEKHGFCEYRFNYNDKSTIYVSTDIYSGSRLNYDNLYQIGVDTYAKSRSETLTDTIKNSGTDKDLHWLEYVFGDVVVGYVNVSKERKIEFDRAIASLSKE